MKAVSKILVGLCAIAMVPLAAAEQKFVNILTGGTSGVYYPLGVALSQQFGKVLPDAKISVQSTKASAENLNLLQAGRGEVGFALGDVVSDAWKGEAEAGFKAPSRSCGLSPRSIRITSRSSPRRSPASRRLRI